MKVETNKDVEHKTNKDTNDAIDWFRGLSWHITVVESLVDDGLEPKIKSDYFVTVMKEQCKQDAQAVGAITKAVLKLHKENNPGIKEYWLRSDQAGTSFHVMKLQIVPKMFHRLLQE